MSSIYFYYASNGIYKILNELDIKEDEEVLVPAWICDEALQSYKLKNCKVIFRFIQIFWFIHFIKI